MDNEKKNTESIDDILNDFSRQKQEHIERFGELAPPERSERQKEKKTLPEKPKDEKKAEKKKAKKEKSKDKKKPKKPSKKAVKKVLICIIAVLGAAGIAGGAFGIFRYSQSAYLKPYKEKYPKIDFPVGIQERFCDDYAKNTSMVGYIEIPDCEYKGYVLSEKASAPYIDSSNSIKELDYNTVIYFNEKAPELEKAYSSAKAYSASTQSIKFSTLYEDYEFTVIGAFYTNSNPADDGGYCFPYNVTKDMTAKSLNGYTDRLTHRFLYNTQYAITANDRLITLAVKSDFMPDFRFIVVGALNAPTQTEVKENKRVHYPQIWYDKNNQTNPYRFAENWYPEIITNEKTGETKKQSASDFTKF